jgi:hypothetical protein
MSEIGLGHGLPETVLPPEPEEAAEALAAALDRPSDKQREATAAVVARWPALLSGWAALGDVARDEIEAYAAYRVGYHRGLDLLRGTGWRGSGFVRWREPSNRGFLRSLEGLQRCAGVIGESDEEERCRLFLLQLDPDWDRREA